jgi:ribosome-binding factor A
MSSLRLQRVRELLKREIGELVRREIPPGDSGLITVNDVAVTSDLQSATVFVGILGSADQRKRGMAEIESHRKHIQGLLGKAVILKYTPLLRFVIDDSIEQGNRVLKIMKELEHSGSDDENTPEDH